MFYYKPLTISITYLLIIGIACNLENRHGTGPNCRVTLDPVFNGSLVNCTNQRLTQSDLIKLPFHGVTTLDISYNNIDFVPDYAFERFEDLKRLMCTRCNLNGIGNFSLKGLDKLEVLRLDGNHLAMYRRDEEQPTIPHGVFQYVPMLKELYIDNNGHYELQVSSYSEYLDIFQYLPELTHLSIDSFRNLLIGKEFLSFSKLYSLRVSCGSMRIISNDSLKGFRNSTVKLFELSEGDVDHQMYEIGLDVFQHLPDVSYFSLRQIRVGNQNALLMMKPLVGRNMFTIRLDSVFSPAFSSFETQVSDTIITAKNAQYLRAINVSNFWWYDSGVYNLEYDMPLSFTWQHNLKSVLLESDALTETSVMLFFEAMLLKKVEVIAYLWMRSGLRNQFVEYNAETTIPSLNEFDRLQKPKTSTIDTIDHEYKILEFRESALSGLKRDYFVTKPNQNRLDNSYQSYHSARNFNKKKSDAIDTRGNIPLVKAMNHKGKDILMWAQMLLNKNISILAENNILEVSDKHLNISLPPKIRTVIMDGMHYIAANHVYTFLNNQVDTIVLSNTLGFMEFHGTIYGLENVTTISLQGSQHLDLGFEFLHAFRGLRSLNLMKTSLTPEFYESYSDLIIEKLTALEKFDLSENELQILPTDMFLTNERLKYVSLANNRFSNIPFNLELTTALEILDLRGNSFVDLSAEDRAAIDSHILSENNKNFTIFLSDNELSCACSNLPFIAWLRNRRHHFDMDGDYSCISEDGTRSSTGAHMDIKVFWRRCRGSYYLMLSGILACSLVAVYLAIFLGMKKKTEIISKVMQIVVPGFRLKTRRDYLFDVCIGYADQDGTYIREVLLSYLEDKWHLRTFVHQRDLRQDPLEMSQALRDSWRCLLLITETFLFRSDMAHNVMKVASFFVSPSNPRSVVVMVEESVRHRIPDYVLQVVDEDNIIIFPRLEQRLDYETKEFLRTRLT